VESTVADQLYRRALQDYQERNYEAAVVNFKQFLKQAPKSPRAGNAQYLIGESLYAQKQYEAAIVAFDEIVQKYGHDPKVAAAILKQGYAFIELKDVRNARFFLQQVQNKYPNSPEGQLAVEKLRQLTPQSTPPPLSPSPQPVPVAPSAPVSAGLQPTTPIPVSSTQYRRALVIGNTNYPDSPLINAVNDATDLATVLRRVSFDVTLHQNADKATMERAIETFTRDAPAAVLDCSSSRAMAWRSRARIISFRSVRCLRQRVM
jgi:tol-pal system protein YbgF